MPHARGEVVSAWHRQIAPALRARLLAWLGGRCERCGETEPSKLSFDHPFGRNYNLQRLSPYDRYRWIYVWEADMGALRILCRTCNSRDGGYRAHGLQLPPVSPQLELFPQGAPF